MKRLRQGFELTLYKFLKFWKQCVTTCKYFPKPNKSTKCLSQQISYNTQWRYEGKNGHNGMQFFFIRCQLANLIILNGSTSMFSSTCMQWFICKFIKLRTNLFNAFYCRAAHLCCVKNGHPCTRWYANYSMWYILPLNP